MKDCRNCKYARAVFPIAEDGEIRYKDGLVYCKKHGSSPKRFWKQIAYNYNYFVNTPFPQAENCPYYEEEG